MVTPYTQRQLIRLFRCFVIKLRQVKADKGKPQILESIVSLALQAYTYSRMLNVFCRPAEVVSPRCNTKEVALVEN